MMGSDQIAIARRGGAIRETVVTLLWAGLLAVGIQIFLFQPFYIPSGSMVPALDVHDYIFVNKFAYGYSRYSLPFAPDWFAGRVPAGMPRRGDVVVVAPTAGAGREDLVKRVVGLPGDTIQVTDGVLIINGVAVTLKDDGPAADDSGGFALPVEAFTETLPGGRAHAIFKLSSLGPMNNTQVYHVPPGALFLMGDNRDDSLDSRALDDLGYVPVENVIGRASIIFFSIDLRHAWYEFWDWPAEIRWDRLLRPVS